jgi:ribosomal protein S9
VCVCVCVCVCARARVRVRVSVRVCNKLPISLYFHTKNMRHRLQSCLDVTFQYENECDMRYALLPSGACKKGMWPDMPAARS